MTTQPHSAALFAHGDHVRITAGIDTGRTGTVRAVTAAHNSAGDFWLYVVATGRDDRFVREQNLTRAK